MQTEKLTIEEFKEKIFDFDTQDEWKYKGGQPAIIDFYADWCGPCRSIAPTLEELAIQYDGKLTIYKVDTEKEPELSSLFDIQSIPTFLFIPMEGTPMMQKGALPKNVFVEIIEDHLIKPVAED